MYEVVWARQLVLVFGNTSQAVSAILTGFFGGMAIGSVRRRTGRGPRPLAPPALRRSRARARRRGRADADHVHADPRGLPRVLRGARRPPQALALVRFGLSLLALGPATILMGATLPALTRELTRPRPPEPALRLALRREHDRGDLGTSPPASCSSSCSASRGRWSWARRAPALAGVDALLLARGVGRPRPIESPGRHSGRRHHDATTPHPPRTHGPVRLALAVAFVAGLVSLGYQVLWTRLLAAGSGNSTYVFTLILGVFLTGIALGAILFTLVRRWTRRRSRSSRGPHRGRCPRHRRPRVRHLTPRGDRPEPPARALGVLSSQTLLVVLPTTIVMGLSFPASSALSRAAARRARGRPAAWSEHVRGDRRVVRGPVLRRAGHRIARRRRLLALMNLALRPRPRRRRRPIRSAVGRVTPYGVGRRSAIVLVVAVAAPARSSTRARAHREPAGRAVRDGARTRSQPSRPARPGLKQLWVTGTSMTALTIDAKLMPILPLIARPDAKDA